MVDPRGVQVLFAAKNSGSPIIAIRPARAGVRITAHGGVHDLRPDPQRATVLEDFHCHERSSGLVVNDLPLRAMISRHRPVLLLIIDCGCSTLRMVADLCTRQCIVLAPIPPQASSTPPIAATPAVFASLVTWKRLCALVAGSSCLSTSRLSLNTRRCPAGRLLVQDLHPALGGR